MMSILGCLSTFWLLGAQGGTPTFERNADGLYELRDGQHIWLRGAIPAIGDSPPTVQIEREGSWVRVRMDWTVDTPVTVDDLAVEFTLPFVPDFWWAPHLAPNEGDVIAQHVFRSPALIAAQGPRIVAVVPDLDVCGQNTDTPWYLDLDAPSRRMWLGMASTRLVGHVHYRKIPEIAIEPGTVHLAFYVTTYEDTGAPRNPWGAVSEFLWARWGRPLFRTGEPIRTPMDRYVEHTNRWAFDTWKDAVWQEFSIDGRRVGSPAFIVNVTESPNFPGVVNLREDLSIWNQAWFSSLRSAAGVFRYAKRTDDPVLLERAHLTKEFALAAPQRNGLFPTVYRSEMEEVEINGAKVRRSKGWDTGHWSNSNRVPWEHSVTPDWYHVLDMSWTGLLMLRWYEELERDERLLEYAYRYGYRLLQLQDDRGFFPAWLHPETAAPAKVLSESPETSMSVTFLLKLADVSDVEGFRTAALRAMDAVLTEIVPAGRWEDFETYWSCNPFGREDHMGRKFTRSGMHKQNNFSMFWTAEALLACFRATGESRYLDWGIRTMDELSMTQQVWQPPFIHVPALGGFGVMNFDGEWNDARQSLFAELYMDYYRETGRADYFERGVAALKSSFVMMYCPENPEVRTLWERVWPFFDEADFGFTMENYGHGGITSPEGEGMGNFTIYTWGNGAAAEARCRIYDHYGDVYVDRVRGQAFGIDSIEAVKQAGGFRLRDRAGTPRDIRIVYDDGSTQTLRLDGELSAAM